MEERKHAPWIKIINLSKGHNMSGVFKQGTSSFELFSWPFPWPSPVFQDLTFSCYNFPKLSFGLGYFFWNNSVQQSQPLTSTKMCVIHGDNIQRLSKVCWKLRSFAMNLTVSLMRTLEQTCKSHAALNCIGSCEVFLRRKFMLFGIQLWLYLVFGNFF